MPSPVEFMKQYRSIPVDIEVDNVAVGTCDVTTVNVKLNKYFQIKWEQGSTTQNNYEAVTSGSKKDVWFRTHKEQISTAAMGKGSPDDYASALQWGVYSGHIKNPSQASIQTYFDQHMGIDCSGFATNYLIANGKKPDSAAIKRNTSAASYFNPARAVNDPALVRQGDLLVLMDGNKAKTVPCGHIMVVESYSPMSVVGGNMRVVESTAAAGATPKLLDSMYSVDKIIKKAGNVPCMILVVTRFGTAAHVSVMRM